MANTHGSMRAKGRSDGFLPIREYAAIGDGRTIALVGSDGAIDWLCLPDLDSASVFGAILDEQRGGRFALAPTVPYESERRYLPDSNVLETTFTTATGTVQVTDALTLPGDGLTPYRELVRRVDGVTGKVPMRWSVDPRFAYATESGRVTLRDGIAIAAAGRDAIAVMAWDAGRVCLVDGAASGSFEASTGTSSLLVLTAAHQEPLVLPPREDVTTRLVRTDRSWRAWARRLEYEGEWREAVVRSALALKLLVFAPSGAIAAAATTSLPEELGGSRNWDYRFAWPRDAALILQALLSLGCGDEARAFFYWLMHASQLTHPRLQVLYRLNGRVDADEKELPLAGYRGSQPVRIGNGAAEQFQLDVYGEVLAAAALFAQSADALDRDHGRRLAEVADLVCELWRKPDAGIWETRGDESHFTHSKMMCAIALDHAIALAEAGHLPDDRMVRWREERGLIHDFVEASCYSQNKRSYVRAAGEEELDASLLLAVLANYDRADSTRLLETVDAVRRELAQGALVRRYAGGDGLPSEDGAFLACSFWLVEALTRQGRVEEARELMNELVGVGNDVGLYAEEMDIATGDYLGNFPQGLSHLALINAAVALAEVSQ